MYIWIWVPSPNQIIAMLLIYRFRCCYHYCYYYCYCYYWLFYSTLSISFRTTIKYSKIITVINSITPGKIKWWTPRNAITSWRLVITIGTAIYIYIEREDKTYMKIWIRGEKVGWNSISFRWVDWLMVWLIESDAYPLRYPLRLLQ